MAQETGETRDAIIEDRNKELQKMVDANSNRTEPYWIVLFAKASKNCVEGKPTLVQHMKAYGTRPASLVGAVIGEVCNKTGEIKWEVNMPQVPFDFDALKGLGGEACDEAVIETTSIADSYITK